MSTKTKTIIRLLKAYSFDGRDWPEGELLYANENAVEELTAKGVAEIYEPQAGDTPYVSPVGGNMSLADIERVVRAIADENRKAQDKVTAATQESNYEKTGGFNGFMHFCHDVFKAGPKLQNMSDTLTKWSEVSRKIQKATGLSEGIGADGGFLLPSEYKNQLLRTRLEASVIRQRATVVPMQTSSVSLPSIAETTRSGSVYGGIIIYRPGEGGTKTASKPAFGKVTLTLNKLIGLVYATDELLEDSPISMEPLFTSMFGEAIAYQEEEDFVNGTGAGMALGVLNSPCLVSVAKETGQPATTILLRNITKMWSRLWPMGHRNALWLANPDTFPQLAELAVTVGTGGSAAGLIGSDATGAPTSTILGRPLDLNPHCQTLGTQGDIILGDWSQYLIGEKVGQQLKVDTSIHVNFVYDETAFRFVMRYDGQPWWASALTPTHGTNTLSPFVVLDART